MPCTVRVTVAPSISTSNGEPSARSFLRANSSLTSTPSGVRSVIAPSRNVTFTTWAAMAGSTCQPRTLSPSGVARDTNPRPAAALTSGRAFIRSTKSCGRLRLPPRVELTT